LETSVDTLKGFKTSNVNLVFEVILASFESALLCIVTESIVTFRLRMLPDGLCGIGEIGDCNGLKGIKVLLGISGCISAKYIERVPSLGKIWTGEAWKRAIVDPAMSRPTRP
jgi:hypothetical protein